MDTVNQRRHIVVTRAHDNPSMRQHFSMQADKVTAIKCHHRSTRCSRERDNGSICDTLACLPYLVWGEDVVAKLP
jgi:hypothetical protein